MELLQGNIKNDKLELLTAAKELRCILFFYRQSLVELEVTRHDNAAFHVG